MKKLFLLPFVFSIITFCPLISANAQGVGINPSGLSPNNSAGLDVNFTNKGFLPPRMTTAQRNLITPVEGLQIYNTDEKCMQFYNGSNWVCGGACIPATPGTISGTTTPPANTPGQIYSISAVSGATTYTWTVPAGWTITGGGGTSTITVTTGSSGGNITVTANNTCGTSGVRTLAVTLCSSFTINHTTANGVAPVNKTVTYGVVLTSASGASKCWITRNLGADQQATAGNDGTEASAGWYWQFNRKQGYKHDGSTRTPNTAWITSINENSDWSIANDPCAIELGAGWRLPTYPEWANVVSNISWNGYPDTYSSILKLHAAGFLDNTNGTLAGRNSAGRYWAGTQNGSTDGYWMFFYDTYGGLSYSTKAFGFSVRCLKD